MLRRPIGESLNLRANAMKSLSSLLLATYTSPRGVSRTMRDVIELSGICIPLGSKRDSYLGAVERILEFVVTAEVVNA